jgi:MFS family permease
MSPRADDDWTFGQATRTRAFWLLLLAGSSQPLISTALTFHHVSFMASRGLPAGVASAVFSVVAVAALAGTFTAGVLSDRFPVRYLLGAGQGLLLAAMAWSFTISATWEALVYGGLLGLSSGFGHTLQSVVWPNYFGRRHLGMIRSVAASSTIASAAVGPLPFGWLFDVTGSYDLPVLLFLALPVAAAVAAWSAVPPRK